MSGPERTPEFRRLAERALVRLVAEMPKQPPIVVLGGLVPGMLVADPGIDGRPEHVGTTDVDLLVTVEVNDQASGPSIERALERAGFSPVEGEGGWRWRVACSSALEGHS